MKVQEFQYFGLGKQGYPTSLVSQQEALVSNYIYKKVSIDPMLLHISDSSKYKDKSFDPSSEDLSEIDGEKYDWVQLSKISSGELFQELGYCQVNQKFQQSINFLKQIRLFPIDYYKTLFATPHVNQQGIYKIILNVSGVFQLVCVDDRIPISVHGQNKSSLFGLKFTHSWQILLLKAYCKIIGGYQNLKHQEPFSFIKAITFNNWKAKNFDNLDQAMFVQFLKQKLHGDITPHYLQESNANIGLMTVASKVQQSVLYQSAKNESKYLQFLSKNNHQKQNLAESHYLPNKNSALVCSTEHSFTMISKTKNNSKIKECGLTPNSSCYRIANLFQIQENNVLRIQSSIRSRWNGHFSIYDPILHQYYSQKSHRLKLDKNFIMSLEDFREIFATTMVSPIDYQMPITSVSSCETVELAPNNKEAQYFQFQISKPGKYDISISQPLTNLIDYNEEIHSFSTITAPKKVYPNIKVLIGRRNQLEGRIPIEAETQWTCVDASFSSNPNGTLTYFQNLIAGRYMIRIKVQKTPKPLVYNLSMISDSPVKLYWVDPPKMQRSLFQRSCMLTLAQQKGDIFYLDSQTCQQWVSYGNSYFDIGYAFIGFGVQKRSPYKLYCEIDTNSLQKQGFKLKFPYKNKGKNIGMFVQPGFPKVLILKRESEPEIWPPASIRFFKVQI